MTNPAVNIGIDENKRIKIARGLSQLLADSYTLYLKTHNYHWNVTGPHFQTLHALFETQYTELQMAVDEIAERIRSLGVLAPGSFQEFKSLTKVQEAKSGATSDTEMVKELLTGHETVAQTARSIISAADEASDEGTLDLLTTRIKLHEKTSWMLRALLSN